MKTLQELNDRLDVLREESHNIKNLIDSHPDTIKSHFTEFKHHPKLKEIFNKIEFIKWDSGQTENYKSPINYTGFVFKLINSNDIYKIRTGQNWCESVNDCVIYSESKLSEKLQMKILQDGTDENGMMTEDAKDWISNLEPPMAIAHMLRCYIGW